MIHLDQASTSFPKPPEVLAAVARWFDEVGVSADRGDGEPCAEARGVVEAVRTRLSEMCGLPRVAFTSGATEALNMALRGLLGPGDAVLTTAFEHSSVVRPLNALREELDLRIEVLEPQRDGSLGAEQFEQKLRQGGFRLLVFSHASNVVGSALAAADLCDLARAHGCTSLVDASQSAGHLALDVGADLLAASAHKGLLGPPGLGFLAARGDVEIRSTKQGGTGSAEALDRHPETWPQAFEAGTPNTPAIFGLHAALEWSAQHPAARDQALALTDELRAALGSRGYRVFAASPTEPRVAITSFTSDAYDPAELGILLAEAGVHVRTGHHCAPWLHRCLGTPRGTVRVSPGPFNRATDIAALLEALP